MKEKLKILHLEDLQTDAELVNRELKKSGLLYDIVVVDNEKEFSRKLTEFLPDIILSDHSLPTFNSFGALKMLQEKEIKIPFILITSTTSEEIAVSVMKAGAWDYLLKDRMQRLPSAIEQAMDKYRVIQDKTNAEEKLSKAHHQLLFHVENSPLGFIEWDGEFKVNHWSQRAEEIFGWPLQEYQALQKAGFDAVFISDLPIVLEKAAELTSGKVSRNHFINRVNTKSGHVIWCEWFNSIQTNKEGKVTSIMSLVSDVTEMKQAELKLAASENRFRSLIENITDGIVVSDAEYNILYQSPSVEHILGYSEEERMSTSLKQFVHPDYLKEYETLFNSILNQPGEPHSFELPFLHKRGNYVWLEGITTNLLNDPSVQGVVANYRDVTQRKMLNDILKEYNDRHEIVSKATNDAIWDWDIERDIEIWNHGTETIFGYSQREVDSSHAWWKERIHPHDYQRVIDEIKEAFHQVSENWVSQYQYRCANGTYKYVLDRAFIVYNENKPVRMIGAMQDISEQILAEQKLRSMNERYKIVLDTTGDAIWDWDIINNEIIWGDGLLHLFGYNVTGSVPLSFWSDKVHHDEFMAIDDTISKALNNPTQTKWECEYRFIKSDGTFAFVQDRGSIMRDAAGKPIRMVGSLQDITERKRAMEEIKQLSLVASKTDNIVIITDADQRIEWVNDSFVKLTGFSFEEVIGQTPRILQGPETDPFTVKRINKQLAAHQPVVEEILNYTKDKSKYWLRMSINPTFNAKGELTKFIAVESDITQQKEYEGNILAIAQELTDLIDNANVPIFGIDRNGYISEWNKTTELLTGYSKDETLGKKWIDFIDPRAQRVVDKIIKQAFESAPSTSFELALTSKDHRKLILLISISMRKDRNKKNSGILCVGQDMTEVIQYRQGLEKLVDDRTRELHEALNKEKELVEMKSKFVSIASHEFRTPLSTISLTTGFVRKHKQHLDPSAIDSKLDTIEKQVNQMVYLLDDVLLVGKGEAGKISVNLSTIPLESLEKLAQEVVESKRTTHQLNFQKDISVPSIVCDPKLLRNIFVNLITNAIKFSPNANSIEVSLICHGEQLIVVVKDHGIGIPENEIPNLFTSFSRASNVGTIEGTGLGLSIVKKAVELLRGKIKVTSVQGTGSEFEVRLPL
jgi:PAS domain S-box-containing protein